MSDAEFQVGSQVRVKIPRIDKVGVIEKKHKFGDGSYSFKVNLGDGVFWAYEHELERVKE